MTISRRNLRVNQIKSVARVSGSRDCGVLVDGWIGVGYFDEVRRVVKHDLRNGAVFPSSNARDACFPQLLSRVVLIPDICLSGGIRVRVIRLFFVSSALIGSRIVLGRVALR